MFFPLLLCPAEATGFTSIRFFPPPRSPSPPSSRDLDLFSDLGVLNFYLSFFVPLVLFPQPLTNYCRYAHPSLITSRFQTSSLAVSLAQRTPFKLAIARFSGGFTFCCQRGVDFEDLRVPLSIGCSRWLRKWTVSSPLPSLRVTSLISTFPTQPNR